MSSTPAPPATGANGAAQAKAKDLREGRTGDPTTDFTGARADGGADTGSQTDLAAAFARVRERIAHALRATGRPADAVALLAVSKSVDARTIAAAIALGQRSFGENYLQEAIAKMAALAALAGGGGGPPLQWHFIGPIQSNKTRLIAAHFDWVQSVERLSIAQRLAAQRPPERAPLQVSLEVNISGEASKSGVAPAELPALALAVAGLPRLVLRGLMAIPAPGLAPQQQWAAFAQLRGLQEALRASLPPATAARFDTLSMGMSADLEAAIAAGSTLVRVGSALFGPRRRDGAVT